ncbi:hypothetical protein QTP88_014137 [Uroleucon formosanum]
MTEDQNKLLCCSVPRRETVFRDGVVMVEELMMVVVADRELTMACSSRWRRSRWYEIAVSHARATGGGPGVFSWVDEREGSPGRTLGNIDRAENTYSPYPRRPKKKLLLFVARSAGGSGQPSPPPLPPPTPPPALCRHRAAETTTNRTQPTAHRGESTLRGK